MPGRMVYSMSEFGGWLFRGLGDTVRSNFPFHVPSDKQTGQDISAQGPEPARKSSETLMMISTS